VRDVRSVKPGENVNELLVWKSLHIGCRWASLVLVTPRASSHVTCRRHTGPEFDTGGLPNNPATFGQQIPAIRWGSARPQGTLLLSRPPHPHLSPLARRHVVVQVWFWLEGG